MENKLNDFDIVAFRQNLIQWYKENRRKLPWRKSSDPYRVWVSEIMLQQTRVDTVIPYYEAFMRKFPTAEVLAEASEDEILKAWEGLGYYSRVRNLQTAVREVVTKYEGIVPNNREEISTLKGVGPYTAGAILSIAYNKPEPAVDGNVMRVLSRILFIQDDIAKASTRKVFERILYDLISKEDPSSFNQGLMELGALICTPTSPGCLLCPVRRHCRANEQGLQETLPIKTKKKKPKRQNIVALIIRNDEGKILIEKRPDSGLLAGLWQFPNIEVTGKDSFHLAELIREQYGFELNIHEEQVQTVKHLFTHLTWYITVYEAEVIHHNDPTIGERQRWVSSEEFEKYAFPVSHQKIIHEILKREKM